jgi:hypothetical protein
VVITHQDHISHSVVLFEFSVRKSAAIVAESFTKVADILQAAMRIRQRPTSVPARILSIGRRALINCRKNPGTSFLSACALPIGVSVPF